MQAVEPVGLLPTEGLFFEGARLVAIPATAGDAARIQACFEEAPDYFARIDGGPPSPNTAAELLADAEADPGRRVYLLVHRRSSGRRGPTKDKAVGVLDLHLDYPEPGTAQIGLLLFREACQGLGYGKETAGAVEAALARAGYRALRLSVVDENAAAKLFWQGIGFAEVGHLDRGITLYEKRLGS